MWRNNVIVHDISEWDGGLQCIEVDDIQIKLLFTDDEKLLTFNVCLPTNEKSNSHTIHWLTPQISSNSSELLKQQSSRRGCRSIVEEEPTLWEKHHGNSTEIVTKKTLEATTQLCTQTVEMENREAPRQH